MLHSLQVTAELARFSTVWEGGAGGVVICDSTASVHEGTVTLVEFAVELNTAPRTRSNIVLFVINIIGI
jgi:hypothetical protein